MSPVIWTARPGSAWHSMTVRRSIDPRPSSSRPRRLVLASASGTEAGCPEAAHPGGGRQGQAPPKPAPPGTSSTLPPPGVEQRRQRTRDGCCRQWSPFVNFVHPASVAVARRRLVAVAAVVVPCACCLPTAGAAGIWHKICRSSSVASSR